jgi:hypothetical protein
VSGTTTASSVSLALAYSPVREPPFAEDEEVARALATAVGGSCDVRLDATGYAATLAVPAAAPDRDA